MSRVLVGVILVTLWALIASCPEPRAGTVSVENAESESNRRRTVVYTTDAFPSTALSENRELSAAFSETARRRAKLANGARRLGANATAEFYEFTERLAEGRILSVPSTANASRPLACVFTSDDASAVRERNLALKLNASDSEEAADLVREYENALADSPNNCRLLSGWSLALLRSTDPNQRTAAHELAVRRLLELANGNVAPSRLLPGDMYATLARYFEDGGDTIGAIAALEYALNSASNDGDATRRQRLATWQQRLLKASDVQRAGAPK